MHMLNSPLTDAERAALVREFIEVDGMTPDQAQAQALVSVRVAPVASVAALVARVRADLVEYERYASLPAEYQTSIQLALTPPCGGASLIQLGMLYVYADWLRREIHRMECDPFYQAIAAGDIPKSGRRHGCAHWRAGVVALRQSNQSFAGQ